MQRITNSIERTVDENMTAEALGSGELPVFATPAMVALIEETCWKSVAGTLGSGKSSVGSKLDIAHVKPSPVGAKVRCESELLDDDGHRLKFVVKVYEGDDLIGEGTHERVIIDSEKFLSKVK